MKKSLVLAMAMALGVTALPALMLQTRSAMCRQGTGLMTLLIN